MAAGLSVLVLVVLVWLEKCTFWVLRYEEILFLYRGECGEKQVIQ